MTEETWVPIKDHPTYLLSNLGRVKSLPRKGTKGGLLTLYEHKSYKTHHEVGGYWGYKVDNKFYPLHLLLGRHFIPNPDNLPCVCHKDDDRSNNKLSNLYWGTPKDNAKDWWKNHKRKKTYTFMTTTGEEVTTTDLSGWCEERGVPLSRVQTAFHRGKPVNATSGAQDKWGNLK